MPAHQKRNEAYLDERGIFLQTLHRAENKKQHNKMIVLSEDDDAMGAGEELANAVWLLYNMPNEKHAVMCEIHCNRC